MAVYLALMQASEYNSSMIDIRVAGDPTNVLPAVRHVLQSLGPHIVLRAETLDHAAILLNRGRILAMLSSFFAGLALLLAAIGLYRLMSYAVSSPRLAYEWPWVRGPEEF
jgi:hypothetical protein